MAYLDDRRLMTYTVQVADADYRYVSVAVEVRARKRVSKEALQAAYRASCMRLSPGERGPGGDGGPGSAASSLRK